MNVIARSANAVMVSDGLTPGFAQPPTLSAKSGQLHRDGATGCGHLKRSLRLIQLSQRAPEAQPGVARVNAESLCDVERSAVERAPELAAQVAILALDGFDQWPSVTDDGDDLLKKLLPECCVHTHPTGAASVTPALPPATATTEQNPKPPRASL